MSEAKRKRKEKKRKSSGRKQDGAALRRWSNLGQWRVGPWRGWGTDTRAPHFSNDFRIPHVALK